MTYMARVDAANQADLSGYRTFVFLEQRDGPSRRRTLGPVNLMSVEEARARCRDRKTDKDAGME